jgi:hypothetical protein
VEKQRYAVLDGFCLGGALGDVYRGQEVEITPREAAPHVAIGRLKPIAAVGEEVPADRAPQGDPAAVEDREPATRTRGRARAGGE